MRKMFLIAVAVCALLAIAPATALAKHRSHHHRTHHARVHHKKFGSDPAPPSTPSGTTTPVNTAPATLSVVKFDPTTGVLTISDASGQQIMGTVTADTRLICVEPQQPPNTSPNTSPTNTAPTGAWRGHDHGGDNGGGDQGGGGNDQGDDQGQGDDEGQDEGQNQCTTADLTPGTPVQFADLSMSSNGTRWDTVVLQVAPSTAPTVSDTDNDGD
jgi:hypothetical protein